MLRRKPERVHEGVRNWPTGWSYIREPNENWENETSRRKPEEKMPFRGAESDDDKGFCKEAQDS
jgi:hypothetical protein